MTTVSKKQKWFNTIRLTQDDDLYVGIDVHKKSLHIALWLNDAPAIDFVSPPDNKKLIDTLNKLRPALRMGYAYGLEHKKLNHNLRSMPNGS
jgi:hypothetical protein